MSSPARYAECTVCGIDLQTPEDKNRHITETMAPIEGKPGHRQAHSYRVVNPTPQERVRRAIEGAMETAVERFCEDIDDEVCDGELTQDDVTSALRHHPDFLDGWLEWVEEGADQ